MPKLVYHDSDGVDKVINLAAEPLTIGRATECEIQTQDAMVSRRHARITYEGNYWIEDLGSSNGVYIGNEKVQKAPFRPGDTVTCGSLVLRMLPDTSARTVFPSAANAVTQPPSGRERIPTEPPPLAPPPPAPPPTEPLSLDPSTERATSLSHDSVREPVARVQPAVRAPVEAPPEPAPAPKADPQIADTVILLSDAVAAVRSNLRAANGEATLLKQPEESVEVVTESLRAAAEALEQARQHLRVLAKLLKV